MPAVNVPQQRQAHMLIFRLEGLAMEASMTDKVKAGFYRAATYAQI